MTRITKFHELLFIGYGTAKTFFLIKFAYIRLFPDNTAMKTRFIGYIANYINTNIVIKLYVEGLSNFAAGKKDVIKRTTDSKCLSQ